MKITNQKRPLFWAGIVVLLLILSIVAFWQWQQRPTLIDLQKEMLTAQSEQEKQEILQKLDHYYLTMPIPEAIQQEVEDSVDALIERFDPAQFMTEKLDSAWGNLDSNIYMIEYNIRGVVRNAMIARSQEDMTTFNRIISHAERMADTVKSELGDHYWPSRLAKARSFRTAEAKDWLRADQAALLCLTNYTGDFEKGEKFAAFGFQCLQETMDKRILLDLTQGFLVILFQYRGLYDLAYPLAERGIQIANEVKYRKRAVGLLFNSAVALLLAGYNHQALNNYLKMLQATKTVRQLPGMDYYEIQASLDLAKAYRLLGKYDMSLSLCAKIEKIPLDNYYKHQLYNTRGITYAFLGKYDLADHEYRKALYYTIADNDTANQIIVLFNIGDLHFRLTEYDKANAHYQDAMSLILEYYPQNSDDRSQALIRFAKLEAARNNIERLTEIIQEARAYIELINNPIVKGRYLVTLGQLNMKVQNYKQASDYFLQATTHYESSGMFRYALESKTALIKSLMELNNYGEAKKQLNDQYKKAIEFNDAPTLIDALGLSSKIAYKKGNIESAIQKSNELISKVEELSSQISHMDILTTYRQKINPYLKDAALYGLRQGWVDSAFIKLDYLKAREAKHRFTISKAKSDFHSRAFIDIDSLRMQLTEKEILLNYMSTEDTLYVFTLHQNELKLFKTAIHINKLRRLGNDYIDVLKSSRKYLDPYQPAAFKSNYDSVLSMGRQLYEILLGWPELKNRLQYTKITYIIPDDILHGIPFSCLNESDKLQPQFLIQNTAIVNLPSAVFLQSSQAEIVTDFKNKSVLICADRQGFPKSDKLVDYIKGKFPASEELMIDKRKVENEDVLSKLSQGYDIYFFIGHSKPNLKFPDLTNIQLTPLRKNDKMPIQTDISLSDLKRIDWSPTEMVFLIGCETAIGKLYEGSGFSGFQQNLLARGAETVMASSWEIDNTMAFHQVERFLDSWSGKRNPALALQKVEMEQIQWLQNDAFYNLPHPFLWKILSLSQIIKS